MEPYACKSLLKNLQVEHHLTPDLLTTDRSTTMKEMIRFAFYTNIKLRSGHLFQINMYFKVLNILSYYLYIIVYLENMNFEFHVWFNTS